VTDSAAETLKSGRVIASHGRRVLVEADDNERIPCALQGRNQQAYCGDNVLWRRDTDAERGIVMQTQPRRTALERTNSVGGTEVLVANLTQLLVVVANEPKPDWFIVDRFVAAAELAGLKALVVRNKSDTEEAGLDDELAQFERIGYRVIPCSTVSGSGMDALSQTLNAEVSVLVGQSGVGKSSIANRLIPGLQAATAQLSAATDEGRHVTSVSTLHHLPHGGDLVDSPGVRDFAPAIERIGDPTDAYREFAEPATHCRFADCRHLREPNCGVLAALEAGAISERRYESFKRLSRLRERLAPAPGNRSRR